MAFEFSLATVLRVRLIQEEREERLLQKIFLEIAHTQQTIDGIDTEVRAATEARANQTTSSVMARDLRESTSIVAALYEYRRELEHQIERLEQLKDAEMARYQKARRERETISDLREKKRLLNASTLARREQRTLDDNFSARRLRR